jgi:hypothetical protein
MISGFLNPLIAIIIRMPLTCYLAESIILAKLAVRALWLRSFEWAGAVVGLKLGN